MFENYRELSAEEQASVRTFIVKFRAYCKERGRYGNLAWGFVRGFPYRRIERSHRIQKETGFEHNFPDCVHLAHVFREFFDAEKTAVMEGCTRAPLHAWLSNPEGAIPAPPPRERAPRKAAE